jgi:hypothetical protein
MPESEDDYKCYSSEVDYNCCSSEDYCECHLNEEGPQRDHRGILPGGKIMRCEVRGDDSGKKY